MPLFKFRARDQDGKLIVGSRSAQSADNLSLLLMKEAIFPIDISLAHQKSGFVQSITHLFQGKQMNSDQLSLFARQMHTLLKAGVTITTALRQLASNAPSPSVSHAFSGMAERLEGGQELGTAMQDYPDMFTPIMIGMIRVGQNTGRLDEAFLSLSQYLELEAMALKRIKSALRYPTFILVAIISAIIMINVFVIPTFATIFTQANVVLPLVTQFFISISDFFIHDWVALLFMVAIVVAGTIYYLKTPKGKLAWHTFEFKIPIIGSILRRIVLLRFARSFSIVIHSGIPLVEGITLTAYALNNEYACREVLAMRDSIQRGKNLVQAASDSALFTSLELQMLSVSEETGELGAMLDQIAAYYHREVDYDLKRLNEVIEPLLIVVLGVVVLMLAFAVYLPIWNLVTLVHS